MTAATFTDTVEAYNNGFTPISQYAALAPYAINTPTHLIYVNSDGNLYLQHLVDGSPIFNEETMDIEPDTLLLKSVDVWLTEKRNSANRLGCSMPMFEIDQLRGAFRAAAAMIRRRRTYRVSLSVEIV